MKQVKINAYQIGLVFKNDVYQRFLKEGKYWFWEKVQVYIYDLTKPFVPLIELNILLQDKELADMLHVVEVKDNEIVLNLMLRIKTKENVAVLPATLNNP